MADSKSKSKSSSSDSVKGNSKDLALSSGGDESLLLKSDGYDDEYEEYEDDIGNKAEESFDDDVADDVGNRSSDTSKYGQDDEDGVKITVKKRAPKPWSCAVGAPIDDEFGPDDYNVSSFKEEEQDDSDDEPKAKKSSSSIYKPSVHDDDDGIYEEDHNREDNWVTPYDEPVSDDDEEESHDDAHYDDDKDADADEYDEDGEDNEAVDAEPIDIEALDAKAIVTFESLNLSDAVLKAIKHEGFEQPTPIQLRSIPTLMAGRDMIGQAQTGTGKTAAFALPILSMLPKRQKKIFAVVLEPTRELALQVAESFSRFAHFIDDFRVAPIYGGASYDNQLRSLRHGAQVVVATPGRLIDLIEKGRLDFSEVKQVVIDEADEMLRMGFIDDVDWILDKIPGPHQTALFSATMPPVIRRIARDHLIDPDEVRIESHTTTATTVRQRYWVVSGVHKIDAMTRMLEVESYEAVLVFVRTKTDAEDVANKLAGRGLACAALHGDIPQRQREKIIERLKNGSLDIIIATDVAARGLDVDRITHVFNYDIPYDAESYVHRIGRTGRAGRTGEAILFVSPRERRALRQIERVTHQRIEPMRMPTIADVNKRRLENFRNQVIETIDAGGLDDYLEVISDILSDDTIEPELLAAALAKMAQRDGSLLLDDSIPEPKMRTFDERERGEREHSDRDRRDRHGGPSAEPVPLRDFPDIKMVRYRLAVGRRESVKPGQIVGAIANEANIESKYIGEISIYESFSTVDLPEGMPEETMRILARARVCGRSLDLREYTLEPPPRRRDRDRDHDMDRDRRYRDRDRERDRDRDDRRPPRRRFDDDDRDYRRGSGYDEFAYMDEGEYRHEKGDINGNSIDYRPGRAPRGRGGYDDRRERRSSSRPRPFGRY